MINKLIQDSEHILLVQPDFPHNKRSRNHHEFLPIGLLKIAALLQKMNKSFKLIHYKSNQLEIRYDSVPDVIFITSLFTYWSSQVRDAVQHYKHYYPDATIVVGGIYATLLPHHCKEYTGCDLVVKGVLSLCEDLPPAYDLVDIDYQIIHTSRGCIRNCDFCGVYKIEPNFTCKKSIKDEIIKKKLIFYDNNILANPYIENILDELIILRKEKKINYLESQSGFDGRILSQNPHLAEKIRAAGFKNIKFAWDHGIEDAPKIHEQIQIFEDVGYKRRDLQVFMIYNNHRSYEELEEKRVYCFKEGVQVADCRNRPLHITSDGYNPYLKHQNRNEYYIHKTWTDAKVRQFRRNVRKHNIAIRYRTKYYSSTVEHNKLTEEQKKEYFKMEYEEVKKVLSDAWNPAEPYKMEE